MANLIKRQVVKALSRFCKDLKEDDFDLSFFRGEGALHCLELNTAYLHEVLSLPACILLTSVVATKVQAKISWTKLKSQPIVLFLEGVNVEVELSNDISKLQREHQVIAEEASKTTNQYGFTEKIVDGVTVQIRHIRVRCRQAGGASRRPSAVPGEPPPRPPPPGSELPQLLIDINRVDLHSTNDQWRVVELGQTQKMLPNRTEIVMYKQLVLQALAITITSTGKPTPDCFSLALNPVSVQLTTKKRIATSQVVATQASFFLDNVLWEINQSQLAVAHSFVMGLSALISATSLISAAGAPPKKNIVEKSGASELLSTSLFREKAGVASDLFSTNLFKMGAGNNSSNESRLDDLPLAADNANVSTSSMEVHISGLILRLTQKTETTNSPVAILQLDDVRGSYYPCREYNYDQDEWITNSHGLGFAVENSLNESVFRLTCNDVIVLPACHPDQVHPDFMRMLSGPANGSGRPAQVPMLTMVLSDYFPKDPTIVTTVPLPALTVTLHPVEVVYNKAQWDTMLNFLALAFKPQPIPESCKVANAGRRRSTAPKEDGQPASLDMRVIVLGPSVVIPPLRRLPGGRKPRSCMLTLQADRVVISNRGEDPGSVDLFTLSRSSFVGPRLFNDSSVHHNSANSPLDDSHLDFFPHKPEDLSLSATIATSIKTGTSMEGIWRIELANCWCEWLPAPNKPPQRLFEPVSVTLLSHDVTKATKKTREQMKERYPESQGWGLAGQSAHRIVFIRADRRLTLTLTRSQYHHLTDIYSSLAEVDDQLYIYSQAYGSDYAGPPSLKKRTNLTCIHVACLRLILIDPTSDMLQSISLLSLPQALPPDASLIDVSLGNIQIVFEMTRRGLVMKLMGETIEIPTKEEKSSAFLTTDHPPNSTNHLPPPTVAVRIEPTTVTSSSSSGTQSTLAEPSTRRSSQSNSSKSQTGRDRSQSNMLIDIGPTSASAPTRRKSASGLTKQNSEMRELASVFDGNANGANPLDKSASQSSLTANKNAPAEAESPKHGPHVVTSVKVVVVGMDGCLHMDRVSRLGEFFAPVASTESPLLVRAKNGKLVVASDTESAADEEKPFLKPKTKRPREAVVFVSPMDIAIINSVIKMIYAAPSSSPDEPPPPPTAVCFDSLHITCTPHNVWHLSPLPDHLMATHAGLGGAHEGEWEEAPYMDNTELLLRECQRQLLDVNSQLGQARQETAIALRERKVLCEQLQVAVRANEECQDMQVLADLRQKIKDMQRERQAERQEHERERQKVMEAERMYQAQMNQQLRHTDEIEQRLRERTRDLESARNAQRAAEKEWRYQMGELEEEKKLLHEAKAMMARQFEAIFIEKDKEVAVLQEKLRQLSRTDSKP